ncbi:hypothetical protein Ciccas_012507 [Cichlidogyrus casuarinus]|uniref:Uncharacterized protein n=1 Tax=Cichlidogyrus casuarinus TaxID=1844966 RepID=A0ABD2PN78_9PLAT
MVSIDTDADVAIDVGAEDEATNYSLIAMTQYGKLLGLALTDCTWPLVDINNVIIKSVSLHEPPHDD